MRTRIGMQVMFAIVLVGVLALSAAAADWKMHVNVPFEFQIGEARLPAGLYTISRYNSNGVLQITGENGKATMFAMTRPVGTGKIEAPRAVFHVFGDRYYLSQVRLTTGYTGQLPQSKAETEYLASKRGVRIAVVVGQ